jgi:hypothetical protein
MAQQLRPERCVLRGRSELMKRCAILIAGGRGESAYRQMLERRGFRVTEIVEWPDDDVVKVHEVVIIMLRHIGLTGTLAARMRAKPGFGNRVLIAIAPKPPTADQRRTGMLSGFDDVVPESAGGRALLAKILQRLRERPEHRCRLPERRRSAA